MKLLAPRIWILSAATLALAACVAPVPQPENMEVGIPDQLPVLGTSNTDAPQLNPSDHWQQFFTDPQLKQLIQQALDFNSDLKAATARVAEARAIYGIQSSERLPHIGAQGDGQRGRVPADLSITQQAVTSGQYQVGLGVSAFELDFWGRVSSLSAAALAQYLATEQARQAFEISLIAMTADAYLQALELTQRVELAKKTVDSRTESQRIMAQRVRVGSSSDLELRAVDSLLLTARSELANLEREKAQNAALIQQLTGYSGPLGESSTLAQQQLERAITPDLPSTVLLQRPDIRAAEQQLLAARANVDAARAAFFPRITLTGFAGTASSALDGLFRGGSGAWTFMPQISLPIFDGGARESNLALAEARKHIAVANYESTIRTAFREVADGLAAHHWLAQQEKEQANLVRSEQDRARLAMIRYEQGSAPYLEVLDAQRSQFAAEQMLLQLQRARLSNTVALYRALGGGVTPPSENHQSTSAAN
ncbi:MULTISPECIES: efflux transporter outer membrane subunit [Paenalcaligenes]|uniref:Efflux transporter outer membrane subunit n=1 Tax=Paenalcaligenes hermetiae TaxID=1157987 RepID=A0ABP9LUV0_9BURK|nr:efflux transporter outer membrane subunit [Paenalcaligenes sp.]